MNDKLETIIGKIVTIDSNVNSIIIENQDKKYSVNLPDSFLDSFNQIESILKASETIIDNQEIVVSLVNVLIDENEIEFNELFQSYIVLEPNWLVNVTSLTQFDF